MMGGQGKKTTKTKAKGKTVKTKALPTKPTSNKITDKYSKFLAALKTQEQLEVLYDQKWSIADLQVALQCVPFKKRYYEAIGLTMRQVALLNALVKTRHHIGEACTSVGVHRTTYYDWLKIDAFKREDDNIIEYLYDDIEQVGIDKIFKDNDTTAYIWFTKTKMKDRGYTDKLEVEQKVTITNVDKLTDAELDARITELEKKL